jgi:uncharacterized protein (DUF1330 family)
MDSLMAAYMIAQISIHDRVEFEKYLAGFMEAFTPYDGRILAAKDSVEVVEGNWPYSRTVILEFPSIEQARNWYHSSAYQAVAQHRFKASTENSVFVEGYRMPQ